MLQWLARHSQPVAWYTLDRWNNDPRRFVAHLAAAVKSAVPMLGSAILHSVVTQELAGHEPHLQRLVNELHGLGSRIVLVLEDYHEIESEAVHQLVAFLLEHQPDNLSVAITSRAEPPLPLPRLRARQRLVEVREQDLRFRAEEAEQLVRTCIGVALSGQAVAELTRRTEGWAAGLQLAGLSLRDVHEPERFIAEFDSRNRFITDYLTDEVLRRQPEEVTRFLLSTCVLERMNAALCEAISGLSDSRAILARLEQKNMFLIALDPRREWYRYHHLFADLLRHHLAVHSPGELRRLHATASDWLSRHGLVLEAVGHALKAEDPERVGQILETHGWSLVSAMQSRYVAAWAKDIPEAVLCKNVERLMIAVSAEFVGTGAATAAWVEAASRQLEKPRGDGEGEARRKALAGLLGFVKGVRTAKQRKYADAARYLLTLDSGTEEAGLLGATAIYAQALAHYWRRDLALAQEWLERTRAAAQRGGAASLYYPAVLNLMELARLRGDGRESRRLWQQASEETARRGWDETVGMGWLHYADAELRYAGNELEAAAAAYRLAIQYTHAAGTNTVPLLATMRLAEIAHLTGDEAAAQALSAEAAREGHRENSSFIFSRFDWAMAHMWLVLGRHDAAQAWMKHLGISVVDTIDPAQEELYIEHARLLLLQHRGVEVLRLLVRLAAQAGDGGRKRIVAEALILQAAAQQAGGNTKQAVSLAGSALALTAPAGEHRFLLEAGPGIAGVLRQLHQRPEGLSTEAAKLLSTLLAERVHPEVGARRRAGADPMGLHEALSPKERQVLRLLAAGHTNEEIAEGMFVSANTVKTHLKRIYAKLEARNRAEAIARAQTLGLLRV